MLFLPTYPDLLHNYYFFIFKIRLLKEKMFAKDRISPEWAQMNNVKITYGLLFCR